MAKQQIIQDELQRRLEERMKAYGNPPVPEPVGSELNPDRSAMPMPVAPGTIRKKNTFAGGY
jgi:hypothetical protein